MHISFVLWPGHVPHHYKKSARELENKVSKSYNIKILWHQIWELDILFVANYHNRLSKLFKSLLINPELPICSSSDIFLEERSLILKHKVSKN